MATVHLLTSAQKMFVFTSVFITAFHPARGSCPGQGGKRKCGTPSDARVVLGAWWRIARCSREFLCVCTLLLRSLVQIFIFQFLSMSLFLNLLFETDSYSNEYLLAKFGFDTAENDPFKVR